MTITVRYFASLKESLGRDSDRLATGAATTVAEVWAQVVPLREPPPNLLAAVNLEYANFQSAVKDGDEVAFFPPVTGG
jgi:sulfur-carrier protein